MNDTVPFVVLPQIRKCLRCGKLVVDVLRTCRRSFRLILTPFAFSLACFVFCVPLGERSPIHAVLPLSSDRKGRQGRRERRCAHGHRLLRARLAHGGQLHVVEGTGQG